MSSPVQISIKNYQSIGDLTFEVAGFTCITGPSNIGKSAILRAISGSLLNKPVTGSVRTGSKSCSVRISSERDGKPWGFLWEKAEKGLNRYTVDGKKDRLENVGQKQPEDIAAFGFTSVRVGDRDLYPWYASQWTPLFLLDEGGPTVTQFISEISGLNVLQDAISLGLKGRRKALDDLKLAEAELAELRKELDKIVNLDELQKMASELDSQAESIREYEARIARCKELQSSISRLQRLVGALSPIESMAVPRNGMAEQIATTLAMNGHMLRLEAAAMAVIALRRARDVRVPNPPSEEREAWAKAAKFAGIDRLRESVAALEEIGLASVPPPIEDEDIRRLAAAGKYASAIEKLRKSVAKLDAELSVPADPSVAGELAGAGRARAAAGEIAKLERELAKLEKEKASTEAQLAGVEKELGEIPSCPTCNRPALLQHTHG